MPILYEIRRVCEAENQAFGNIMNGDDGDQQAELLQAQGHVWNHVLKYISSMTLKCAVQLGIPDIIHSHGQPMSLSSLTTALHLQPAKAQCLGRVMRLLVHSGFFAQTEHEQEVKYTLTPASRLLLQQNTTLQITPIMFLNLDRVLMAPWESLSSWFCSPGERSSTPFEMANGRAIWDYLAHEPRLGNLFHQAMVCDSQLIASVVTRDCGGVFEGLKSIVDVGGGTGVMAKAIVEAFPHITCTVLDRPEVVSKMQPTTKNLSFLGGDMFEAKIPPADAVLLKWILHDWDDEESVRILQNCKEAIPSKDEGGKVIIIDMVVDDKKEDEGSTETQLYFDLMMMVHLTGRERNEKEWKNLFFAAGFSSYEIISRLGLRSLIEVYP